MKRTIPPLAREHPTKMLWDWSKAGKPMNGKKVIEGEVKGKKVHVFHIKKGEFIWAVDEPPEYLWYNGTMQFTLMGDKVDDTKPAEEVCVYGHGKFDKLDPTRPMVRINWCDTGYDDPKARIYPVKVHRGKQPYDPVTKSLVVPKLFPCGPDKKGAFWKSFDWGKSISVRMTNRDGSCRICNMGWTPFLWARQKMRSFSRLGCQDPAGAPLFSKGLREAG